MSIEIKLPSLGEGVDTGDVLELLVKEGDIVAKDQGIIELETGKATLQVPSSAAGKISKIHVRPGQTIPPGTLLMTLEAAEAKETGDKRQGTGDRAPRTATGEKEAEKAGHAPEPEKAPNTEYSVPAKRKA